VVEVVELDECDVVVTCGGTVVVVFVIVSGATPLVLL
jgi:hypothetical protein